MPGKPMADRARSVLLNQFALYSTRRQSRQAPRSRQRRRLRLPVTITGNLGLRPQAVSAFALEWFCRPRPGVAGAPF